MTTLERIAAIKPPCRTWPNVAAFLKDLSDTEKAAIMLSQDPRMAVARMELLAWPGQIWANNEQLQSAFAIAIELGILTQARVDQLCAK